VDIFDKTQLRADIAWTEIDDVPFVLLAFPGRLVAGVGKALRIYDIGLKKRRKAENKVLLQLHCLSNHLLIFIWLSVRLSLLSTLKAPAFSLALCRSRFSLPSIRHRVLVFADDGQPRWITCSTMVDYTTVAAGRFGNIFNKL
jgi:splicing factor 3B subunit 3